MTHTISIILISLVLYIEGQVTTDFEDGNGILVISYAPNTNGTFVPVSGIINTFNFKKILNFKNIRFFIKIKFIFSQVMSQ